MDYGKYRGRQQRIGKRALKILEDKFPDGFAFRPQEGIEDFGVDCELEPFERIGYDSDLERISGVIFKGQVRGVEDGSTLELESQQVLSKQFEMNELFYWYEQLRVPLVIFLVDLATETVYWTEYYSDAKLRSNYQEAKIAGQSFVQIHFAKNKTIPETAEDLLRAVNRAWARMMIASFPDLNIIEEHLRDQPDLSTEIQQIEYRRELTYYHQLTRLINAADWDKVIDLSGKILDGKSFSDRLKLNTIYILRTMIFKTHVPRVQPEDKFAYVLNWQVEAIKQFIHLNESDDLLVQKVAALMENVLGIRVSSNALLNFSIETEHFAANNSNLIAQLMIPIIQGREIFFQGFIRYNIEEYNRILGEVEKLPFLLNSLGFIVPLLAHALQPYRHYLKIRGEYENLASLTEYLLQLLKLHASISESLTNADMISQCLFEILLMQTEPEDDQTYFDIAQQVVSEIENQEFKVAAQTELNWLIGRFTPMVAAFKKRESEMEVRKKNATWLAKRLGYDLSKDS
ncbi:DUF4365 domain-containing protein, partial [bacterium]|nr:DUF4365 domain-containing protein [bacterium]